MEKRRSDLARHQLFATLLAWVVGTWVQPLQASLSDVYFYVAYLAVAGVFIAYIAINGIAKNALNGRKNFQSITPISIPICMLLASGCMAFGVTGLRAVAYASHQLQPVYEGRDIEVVGVVSAMPHINEMGTRFQLDVESANLLTSIEQVQSKQSIVLPSKISLSWYGGVFGLTETAGDMVALQRKPMPILPGERWQMTVRLKAPHGNLNPGGFDFELWLWEQGIQATGYVRTGTNDAAPMRLNQTWRHPVEQVRYKVRDAIFARMSSSESTSDAFKHSSEAGIVAALVTGDQQSIDRADWDVFRVTGVAHLMSISGLHITMFAWGAVLIVGSLYRRSSRLCLAYPATHAALLGGLILAIGYAVFSGWGVPSQRTILMLATVTVLRLMGKRWPWSTVWMLACAVVVVVDPWALLQAGFWLSFVAVGVLFATDLDQHANLEKHTNSDSPKVSRTRSLTEAIKKKLWMGSREQFIITLVLAPLTLLLFGQVSVVGLLANALAIPWVTLVVTPLAMLGALFSPLWDLAGFTVHALSRFLALLAALPFATVSVAVPHLMVSAIAVLGGVLLVMPWPWQLRLLGLPFLLPVILWQAPRPADGQFELIAADIGQGNAVIVRTANRTLVYDAGPRYSIDSDAGHRVLVPLLRTTNEKVDVVMLSHRDSDHSGGIKSVLAMHPKANFISSIESIHELQSIRPAQRCVAGQAWRWDGVDFSVLHPSAVDYDSPQKSNAMSCVLRISTPKASVLLAGDIELAQEARLVVEQKALNSTVILMPHHGSKTSSSAAFLDAVQPQIAVVQAGYRNRFGHPAASVLERYSERNIKVIDTVHCGALLWASSIPTKPRCQRDIAKRYWHHQVP
ncbi:MAG: DNA internalization-related competence protein ComEC/Rec2 [Burkholderiaceae bacterium]